MIGSPISIGQVSEVVPVAPRPGVWAPLVMERLLERNDQDVLTTAAELADLARSLPTSWQQLVSAELSPVESQLTYERFIGVTLRELCVALRSSGRVLPIDVLRAVIEQLCEGLAALPVGRTVVLSDRSVGISVDGRWRFAQGALNHWLAYVPPPNLAADPEFDTSSPDTLFYMSPEAFSSRPERAASLASRAALLSWQVATGGFHPYRGRRHEIMASFIRYARDEVRVPLSVHPELSSALIEILTRGIAFTANRFDGLPAFRAALEPLWPAPAASAERTLGVIAGLTWPAMQKELALLKREPLLPIRWDGVWSGARTPEQGIAVLEDQLLERLEPLERLPLRSPFEEARDQPQYARAPPAPPAPHRAGLLDRFLALFRRQR